MINAANLGSAAAQAAAAAQSTRPAPATRCSSGERARRTSTSCSWQARRLATPSRRFCYEADLHGGGIDAAVQLTGSGPMCSSGASRASRGARSRQGRDIVDQYVETLCGGATRSTCSTAIDIDMTTFIAGTSVRARHPGRTVTSRETVHGLVSGYATVERRACGDLGTSARPRARGDERDRVRGAEQQHVHDPASFASAAERSSSPSTGSTLTTRTSLCSRVAGCRFGPPGSVSGSRPSGPEASSGTGSTGASTRRR